MRRMWSVVAACALLGCGDEVAPYDRNAMLTAVAERVVLPTHELFAQRAEAFARQSEALCGGGAISAAALEQTRGAWWSAREAMERGEAFGVGPWRTAGLGALLDRWPTDAVEIDALLAGEGTLDAGLLPTLGANKRGFPALEYLLWADEGMWAGEGAGRRCELVVTLARDVEALAASQLEGWRGAGGFAEQLGQAGRVAGMYKDPQEALGELVNVAIGELEMIVSGQLAKPLGRDNGGTPVLEQAECWRSGRSLDAVRANLEGARLLYEGAEGSVGLGDMVARRNAGADRRLREAFVVAFAALDAVPTGLEEGLEEAPEALGALQEAVRVVLRLWKTEVVGALGVTLTFNDNDGD